MTPASTLPPTPPATVADTYAPIATFSRSGGRRRTRKTTRHVVSDGTNTPWRNLAATRSGKLVVAAQRKPQREASVPPERVIGRAGKRSASRPNGKVASATPQITAGMGGGALGGSAPQPSR